MMDVERRATVRRVAQTYRLTRRAVCTARGYVAGRLTSAVLADGRAHVASAWWLATFPGPAVVLSVLSIDVIGDWHRDGLDSRLRHAG